MKKDKVTFRRITLIGPVLPLRGGVAQHTTMLHRALIQKNALSSTVSFSRQYPSWLYPGESDRDPAYENYREPGVSYSIDSLNPMTWRRAATEIEKTLPDAVVITWWTVYWTFCFLYICKRLRKARIPIVLFCHNVIEHESAPWKRLLTRWIFHHARRFVVHTKQDAENLQLILREPSILVHPHPIYTQFPPPLSNIQRRASLELLFYGFVRPYKGLDILLEAIALLKGHDIALTIAGEFWKGETATRAQIRRLGIEDLVELRPHYHSEQETAKLFARADCLVLPYRSATGSGVVPIAYHYNTPVIVTKTGGMPDVVEHGVTGFLVDPGSPQSLADGIRRCVGFHPSPKNFYGVKKQLSWQSLAQAILTGDFIS